jgi:hypothetical protein
VICEFLVLSLFTREKHPFKHQDGDSDGEDEERETKKKNSRRNLGHSELEQLMLTLSSVVI